jgi:hypothetical protein
MKDEEKMQKKRLNKILHTLLAIDNIPSDLYMKLLDWVDNERIKVTDILEQNKQDVEKYTKMKLDDVNLPEMELGELGKKYKNSFSKSDTKKNIIKVYDRLKDGYSTYLNEKPNEIDANVRMKANDHILTILNDMHSVLSRKIREGAQVTEEKKEIVEEEQPIVEEEQPIVEEDKLNLPSNNNVAKHKNAMKKVSNQLKMKSLKKKIMNEFNINENSDAEQIATHFINDNISNEDMEKMKTKLSTLKDKQTSLRKKIMNLHTKLEKKNNKNVKNMLKKKQDELIKVQDKIKNIPLHDMTDDEFESLVMEINTPANSERITKLLTNNSLNKYETAKQNGIDDAKNIISELLQLEDMDEKIRSIEDTANEYYDSVYNRLDELGGEPKYSDELQFQYVDRLTEIINKIKAIYKKILTGQSNIIIEYNNLDFSFKLLIKNINLYKEFEIEIDDFIAVIKYSYALFTVLKNGDIKTILSDYTDIKHEKLKLEQKEAEEAERRKKEAEEEAERKRKEEEEEAAKKQQNMLESSSTIFDHIQDVKLTLSKSMKQANNMLELQHNDNKQYYNPILNIYSKMDTIRTSLDEMENELYLISMKANNKSNSSKKKLSNIVEDLLKYNNDLNLLTKPIMNIKNNTEKSYRIVNEIVVPVQNALSTILPSATNNQDEYVQSLLKMLQWKEPIKLRNNFKKRMNNTRKQKEEEMERKRQENEQKRQEEEKKRQENERIALEEEKKRQEEEKKQIEEEEIKRKEEEKEAEKRRIIQEAKDNVIQIKEELTAKQNEYKELMKTYNNLDTELKSTNTKIKEADLLSQTYSKIDRDDAARLHIGYWLRSPDKYDYIFKNRNENFTKTLQSYIDPKKKGAVKFLQSIFETSLKKLKESHDQMENDIIFMERNVNKVKDERDNIKKRLDESKQALQSTNKATYDELISSPMFENIVNNKLNRVNKKSQGFVQKEVAKLNAVKNKPKAPIKQNLSAFTSFSQSAKSGKIPTGLYRKGGSKTTMKHKKSSKRRVTHKNK